MEKDTNLTESDGEQPRDNFYHGVISKIFWSNETGVIHSDSGKEVPFIFAFITLLGAPRQDINFLRPGMRVGFDVGWTSKGLRASTIKIYDLYQDDIAPGRSDASSYAPDVDSTVRDHPISRYRPQEVHDTAEPPRYRQRRSRPRPQPQENNPPDVPPQEQAHKRLDVRPQRQENRRPDAPPQGQELRRPDVRPRGQEQRRPDPRPQGQRRADPPRPATFPSSGPSESGQAKTTPQQPNERDRPPRRRRGRR